MLKYSVLHQVLRNVFVHRHEYLMNISVRLDVCTCACVRARAFVYSVTVCSAFSEKSKVLY